MILMARDSVNEFSFLSVLYSQIVASPAEVASVAAVIAIVIGACRRVAFSPEFGKDGG